jgi:enterochelin esterase-like enzyme
MVRLYFPGLIGMTLLLLVTACGPLAPTAQSSAAPFFTPGTAVPENAPPAPVTPTVPTSQPLEKTAAPQLCDSQQGSIEPYQITWQDATLTGRIYLPPCYSQDLSRYYPTLFLLHGATETDQEWDDLGIDEQADLLIDQGKIPPLLIVMPREVTWLSVAENPFGDRLAQVLVPWVERHYRALPDRQHRAVGGMSRGGNWAVRLGLLHWGLFGSLGGHSTPLFFGDLKRVPGWLEAIPPEMMPRIYLDIGEGDNNLQDAEGFYKTLVKAGVNPEWHLSPGLHDEAYWQAHLEEYLLWYSAGWEDQ